MAWSVWTEMTNKSKHWFCFGCANRDKLGAIPDELKPIIAQASYDFCKFSVQMKEACDRCPACLCMFSEEPKFAPCDEGNEKFFKPECFEIEK